MQNTEHSNETPAQEQKQYTKEEIAELRLNMKKFYEEEIPYLELQATYEKLLAEIETAKLHKMEALLKTAYLYSNMQENQENSEDKDSSKEDAGSDAPVPEIPDTPKHRTLKSRSNE